MKLIAASICYLASLLISANADNCSVVFPKTLDTTSVSKCTVSKGDTCILSLAEGVTLEETGYRWMPESIVSGTFAVKDGVCDFEGGVKQWEEIFPSSGSDFPFVAMLDGGRTALATPDTERFKGYCLKAFDGKTNHTLTVQVTSKATKTVAVASTLLGIVSSLLVSI